MRESFTSPSALLPRTWGLLILVLAWGGSAQSASAATCGDYVHGNRPDLTENRPHPVPCQGPSCQRRDQAPVSPPVSESVSINDRDLIAPVDDPDQDSRTSLRANDPSQVRPVHRAFPPDRPPRN